MSLNQLEARIRRLEDIEEIRRVRGEYALAADERRGNAVNVDRTMKLFASDSVWDGSPRWGRHEGWYAIDTNLRHGNAGINWSLHWQLGARIEIHPGGKATARWYLFELANMLNRQTGDRELVWLTGLYDDHYVVEGGEWKFSVVRFDCQSIKPAI